MDTNRRKTLEVLLELATGEDPSACWDAGRAVAILRNQTTAEELAEAGATPEMIAEIWPEQREP